MPPATTADRQRKTADEGKVVTSGHSKHAPALQRDFSQCQKVNKVRRSEPLSSRFSVQSALSPSVRITLASSLYSICLLLSSFHSSVSSNFQRTLIAIASEDKAPYTIITTSNQSAMQNATIFIILVSRNSHTAKSFSSNY